MELTTTIMFVMYTVTLITALPSLPVPTTINTQAEDIRVEPEQLLKAFGLSEPGIRRWQSEPPQYMLDLYNQVADSNGLTRLPGPYGATIIRAFSEKGVTPNQESLSTFTLTGMGVEEEVLEVEFHFYHSRLTKNHRHLLQDNIYQLEVQHVSGSEQEVVGKQHIAAHSSGWRVFRVGGGVVTGAEGNQRTVVLQVSASTLQGHRLPLTLHHESRGTRQPLLVIFTSRATNTTNHITDTHIGANRMVEMSSNRVRRSVSGVESSTTTTTTTTTTEAPPRNLTSGISHGCERRDMQVDFETIGWSSWIVYPKMYNAFQCSGECRFPLGQNLNPTNHATVQSIINHSGHYPEVQRPCCVPSQYGNFSLLFYDASENVVLRQYDKMVATQCGCH